MKSATPAVLFVLLLTVSAGASEGVLGNWRTAVDPDAPDTLPTLLSLNADEAGAISGTLLEATTRYTIVNATVSGNGVALNGVNLPEHNGTGETITCNGVVAEGTIDITCQTAMGGARRWVLAPNPAP